jgi:threonine dehydrogenase-like Zn-dependent dehydrogenase
VDTGFKGDVVARADATTIRGTDPHVLAGGVRPGDVVAVVGAGPVGRSAITYDAAAAARPAARPENRQPPRNVPSRDR